VEGLAVVEHFVARRREVICRPALRCAAEGRRWDASFHVGQYIRSQAMGDREMLA